MSLSLAFRFPHRQYHATPWNEAVNSGAVEWPPSPWRIARALLSVWHTRFPDLERETIERIVAAMVSPPVFLLPATRHGHTRHYLPDLDHRSGATGATTLTHAPYVAIDPGDELVVTWPGPELGADDREALAGLVASIPYLGRAESVCAGRLLEGEPDESEARQELAPHAQGPQRVLCLAAGVTLEELETTPGAMRRSRRLQPAGSRWVGYPASDLERPAASAPHATPRIEAIRWRVVTRAPYRSEFAVMATDRLRWKALKGIDRQDDTLGVLHGHGALPQERGAQHRHAHWLWTECGGLLEDLVLWAPDGVPGHAVPDLLRRAGLPASREPGHRGFVPGQLHLVATGSSEHVMADLGAGHDARHWRSVTPFLMSLQMRKRRTWEQLIVADVERELKFRLGDAAPQARLAAPPEPARRHRRYRWGEHLGDRRVGWHLDLEFDGTVGGPLVLGALSHFGFGRFSPVGSPDG